MILFISMIIAMTGLLPNFDDAGIPDEIEKIDLNLKENEYAFTVFDLNSGDSSILQGANGSTIMINTGAAEETDDLKRWLRLYGVKKIDAVILTKAGKGYDDNIKEIVAEYNVPRVIASKKIKDNMNGLLEEIPDTKLYLWNGQSKETFLDGIEISVINEGENEGLDLSVKIRNNQLLYITASTEIIREKLMKLPESGVQIVKAPFKALPLEVVEHLDPQAVILNEDDGSSAYHEMVQKSQELWIEVFNTDKQGTVTTKFTETTHEIFPIRNFLHTKP